jgi:hypothetical protein
MVDESVGIADHASPSVSPNNFDLKENELPRDTHAQFMCAGPLVLRDLRHINKAHQENS